jgi:hypothetical protein
MTCPTALSVHARRTLTFVAVVLPLTAASALAQPAAPSDDALPIDSVAAARTPTPDATPTMITTGPTLSGAAVAAHVPQRERRPSDADARAATAPRRAHAGPAVALMLVGATAVVLGLVVGGDAQTPLVVGGAVVGLIGLYQYLL